MQTTCSGSTMFQFCKRLKALKSALKTICKNQYSDIHQRLAQAREELLALQIFLLNALSDDTIVAKKSQVVLGVLLSIGESF